MPVLSDGIASMVPGISEKTGSTTSFVHADRMGSTKALSSSATVSFSADYDAFGKVISTSGSSATQKGFAGGFGYQEDGESGYKLLGHRYYDADSGRFLTRDPAFASRNWYNYCENDPLNYADPEGLMAGVTNTIFGLTYDSEVSRMNTDLWRKKGALPRRSQNYLLL